MNVTTQVTWTMVIQKLVPILHRLSHYETKAVRGTEVVEPVTFACQARHVRPPPGEGDKRGAPRWIRHQQQEQAEEQPREDLSEDLLAWIF